MRVFARGILGLNVLFLVLFASFLAGAATAMAQGVVEQVSIEGNGRIETATILLQVSTEPGLPLSQEKIAQDIKAIYRTGFFEQVIAKRRSGSQGEIVTFVVVEKPAIREIQFEGNEEVSSDTLKEKLNIEARKFLDVRKINLGIEEVKKYYESQGYYGTSIEYTSKPIQENQVDLTFKIIEGQEKVIRELVFEGNKDLEDDDLADLIKTAEYSWWKSWALGTGVVKEEDMENDIRILSHHYLTQGYVDARVTKPVVEETEAGLRVVFKIEEGDVYKIGSVQASGTLLEDSQSKTLEGVATKAGEVFNVDNIRQDTFSISEKFTDIGYAFANVDPVTNINRGEKEVDLNFTVDKGQLIQVNRINITGNDKTKDNVVRRSLKIEEQELFSSSKIKRSQDLLQRLGYFDEVTIAPEPTGRQNEVDLNVAVREGTTGQFSAGAGISSGDGFIVTGRVSENNVFGTGNVIALDLNSGETNNNYVLSFENPRVNDSYWSMGLEALSTEREYDDFDRSQTGGAITFGYPLVFLGEEYLDDMRFSMGYELMEIDISNVEKDAPELVIEERGTSLSSSVIPTLTRNTIDSPVEPSKGSRQVLRTEFAGLGGDEEFWLAQLSNSWYYPLWDSPIGKFVFSQRTRLGWGETWNNEDFPLFKRFFPGGINSVRGFEARELGPKDEQGNEYGGNKQLVGNFEVIFPLLSSIGLSGVTFYDVGNAFDDGEPIEFSELRHAVGWGIRWRSPLAPIRIEFGYPLDKEEGDKSFVTNFSFGAPQ